MSPPSSFANYPKPEEYESDTYVPRVDTNPALRGLPLVIASRFVSGSTFVAKFFWGNAGFGDIVKMPGLDGITHRLTPSVIPQGKTGPMLAFEPHLLTTKFADVQNRYYTASDYHALYKTGELTPLQVVTCLLPLIKQGQSPPGLYEDAWVDSYGEEHRALAAAEASTARYAEGKPLSVLDGVPIGVKDDISVEGYRNHYGMRYRPGDEVFAPHTETSWPVQKLQEAGAVVLGKNRMHELGSDTTGCNVMQGTPTNHMNPAYYPGGSSSGGSSAMGAGVVPIAIGTDAGGSCRIPPAFNGAYGMKLSHDRSTTMPIAICTLNPMAATVADLTIAYRIMTQPDPSDPIQGAFALSHPRAAGDHKILGIPRAWFDSAAEPVKKACYAAVSWLQESRGYEVVDIEIPHIAEAQTAHAINATTQILELIRSWYPKGDCLNNLGSANRLLLSVANQTPARDFLRTTALTELIMRHLAFLFQKYPGLLIVTPTVPFIGVPKHKGDAAHGMSDVNLTLESMRYVWLANTTGTPAVSAPVAYAEPTQGSGSLPISIMATGEWGAEESLLQWADDVEDYLNTEYQGGRRRAETWLDVLNTAKSVGKETTSK